MGPEGWGEGSGRQAGRGGVVGGGPAWRAVRRAASSATCRRRSPTAASTAAIRPRSRRYSPSCDPASPSAGLSLPPPQFAPPRADLTPVRSPQPQTLHVRRPRGSEAGD